MFDTLWVFAALGIGASIGVLVAVAMAVYSEANTRKHR